MAWTWDPLSVAVLAAGIQFFAAELGSRLGSRAAATATPELRSQVSTLQAAVLGLLGLLLGFSFSMALSRYETRRGLVVAESNAIGTAWLRAGSLPAPRDGETQALLQRYVGVRIELAERADEPTALDAAVAESVALQHAFWAIGLQAAVEEPSSLPRALLLEALNSVIDLQESRLAAFRARVPRSISVLLVFVAACGAGSVGFAYGLIRVRHRATALFLGTLIAGILFVVLDLDRPQQGLIRVSQQSLESLYDWMGPP